MEGKKDFIQKNLASQTTTDVSTPHRLIQQKALPTDRPMKTEAEMDVDAGDSDKGFFSYSSGGGARRKTASKSMDSCFPRRCHSSSDATADHFHNNNRRPSLNPDALRDGMERLAASKNNIIKAKMKVESLIEDGKKVTEELEERDRHRKKSGEHHQGRRRSSVEEIALRTIRFNEPAPSTHSEESDPSPRWPTTLFSDVKRWFKVRRIKKADHELKRREEEERINVERVFEEFGDALEEEEEELNFRANALRRQSISAFKIMGSLAPPRDSDDEDDYENDKSDESRSRSRSDDESECIEIRQKEFRDRGVQTEEDLYYPRIESHSISELQEDIIIETESEEDDESDKLELVNVKRKEIVDDSEDDVESESDSDKELKDTDDECEFESHKPDEQ